MVHVLSCALDVPIYFSTYITGAGDGQDWLMEGKMVKGVMERVCAGACDALIIYLDVNRAAKSGLVFGPWWWGVVPVFTKFIVDAVVRSQPGILLYHTNTLIAE